MNLEKLFNPRSIAIVGASPEDGKVGNAIAKNILELGYAGKVYLINPKYDQIFNLKCYRKLSEVEGAVDLVIIAIPAKLVVTEIEENSDKAKNFVIVSAGFSEMGADGKEREAELSRLADEKDLNILGPNCLGFIIPKLKLNASFASGLPEAGNVAFITQSGALAVALTDLAKAEKIYFSKIISIGNKLNISETEMLTYLENDPDTAVIAMYLEGIKSGAEFMETARRVSQKKPIVVLKAGKTERTQKAITSHTGALAGSDEIMDAVFQKAGILRAKDLAEFFSLVGFISHNKPMTKSGVAVITNAGGVGVLATDAFMKKKISLAEFSEKTKQALRKNLPEESSIENPIDLLGDALEDRYKKVLQIIEKEKEIGAVICLLTPQDQTPVKKIARVIAKFNAKSAKVVAVSFIGGKKVEGGVKKLREENIFNFSFPESAVAVLDAYYRWNLKDETATEKLANASNNERKNKARAIIDLAKRENRHALYFSESWKLMELYGIKTNKYIEISTPGSKSSERGLLGSGAGFDFPVVLKVDSEDVLHKTDQGGLILNIKNKTELAEAVEKMQANFHGKKLIIQPMLKREMEIILGIKRDVNFGPIVAYGLGGIYTEVFKLAEMLIPPFFQAVVEKSLQEGKLGFLFRETRGQKAHNISELARIICAVGEFSLEQSDVLEFDINPLLIYNSGSEAMAVDVKVII
jgi:acetyltransferase